ncbi:MAG: hypothetical protein ACLQHK_13280 [Gallionellaceae bacterium]
MNTLYLPVTHDMTFTIAIKVSDTEAKSLRTDILFAGEYREALSIVIADQVAQLHAGLVEDITNTLMDTLQIRDPITIEQKPGKRSKKADTDTNAASGTP